MRLNQYVALHTGVSRRRADQLIRDKKVLVNSKPSKLGQIVSDQDKVTVDNLELKTAETELVTIMLHKPSGYVASRDGQGSKTIYELLPQKFHNLKPVGRLDKDSSGLLLLTNNGELANKLTHPRYKKEKIYEVELNRDLTKEDFETITKKGVNLEDGVSKFRLDYINDRQIKWKITMTEGRNRQIRRTFEALGYKVRKLHRTQLGDYKIGTMQAGKFSTL